MQKRWLSLLVENEIGVLARITGLFSGKSYNLDSLTVGITEDNTISRMTIGLTSDDQTFEQIKKQLNRSIEVIKVIDFTNMAIHQKELMYIRISLCTEPDMQKISWIMEANEISIVDFDSGTVLLECSQTEQKNDNLIRLIKKNFVNRVEIIRGGSVAIEAVQV